MKYLKLKEIAKLKNGKKCNYDVKGIIPVYGSNGIIGYTDNLNSPENSIIIGRVGANAGSVFYSFKKHWVSDNAISVVPNINKINSFYLYYALYSLDLNRLVEGSAQPLLNQSILNSLEIRVPPLSVQNSIVEKIRAFDEKIALNNQINDNLLELLDTRFKQFISSSKLTDTTLHNIAIIHSGGNKPKKFSKVKTNEYSVPVYSNGVSKKGLFGFTNKAKVNERAVTVSARGTIGFTVLHNKPFVPIVRLVYLTYKSVPINFLYLLVRSLNIQGYGSTQQQITVPYLRKLKIKIPDANEINKFDAENLSLFDLIWIKEKENILLFKIKENLLEKYF